MKEGPTCYILQPNAICLELDYILFPFVQQNLASFQLLIFIH